MKTFNADQFRIQLEILSKNANSGCGLIYELYQRRLSAAIDGYIDTIPAEHHAQAIAMDRNEFDYLSAAEIADEIQKDIENGFCSHGIERDCCPLGCGDMDDY